MRKLNKETKDQLLEILRGYVEGYAREGLPHLYMAHQWVCGLLENADTHAAAFFEKSAPRVRQGPPLTRVVPASEIDPAKGLRASDYVEGAPKRKKGRGTRA